MGDKGEERDDATKRQRMLRTTTKRRRRVHGSFSQVTSLPLWGNQTQIKIRGGMRGRQIRQCFKTKREDVKER